MDNLDYMTYINLVKKFDSTVNLYNCSKDKIKFEKKLFQKGISLKDSLKSSLINSNKKVKANKIYNYLKSKNINIIPFNSKYYPSKLKNIFSPPLCIFVSGNIEKINKKKIYVYENDNASEYARKIKNYIYAKIIYLDNTLILNKNFKIKFINIENEYYNIEKSCINSYFTLYFNKNLNGKNIIRNIEVISGILDLLIIPQAGYTKNITILVDSMLENGNNIAVFPNEIFNKNAFFSNYLIQNGANMITNIYEIKNIINEL